MVTQFKFRFDWLLLVLSFVCVNINDVTCATQAEERSSQKVKIKLYDLSTSEWTSSKRSTFSTVIAAEANTYCTDSPSSCGLDAAATFTSSEVGTSSADKDGNSIEFTFYIDFPAGASVSAGGATAHVVPKSAAQAIAGAARDEVKDEVGYYITYVDDEYYSIPPDGTTNRIIIPTAFVAVFLLGIAVIALHYYQKHKDRKEKILQRLNKKKQQQITGNASYSYSALDTTNTTILTANNSTTPRRGLHNNNNVSPRMPNSHKFSTRDKVSRDEPEYETGPVVLSLAKKPPSPTKMASVNEFHDGVVMLGDGEKINSLEPLSIMENLEEDEARRERKRRRKEKRRERKKREEGVMETSYENPAFNSSNISDGSNQHSSALVYQ